MESLAPRFDLGELLETLEQSRTERVLSWADLGREVGVAASTIKRFGEADDAEADGVLAVIRWLEVVPETFVPGSKVTGEPLAAPGKGMVRTDVELVAEAAGERLDGRKRTTIQRLTAVAQATCQPITSFTKLRDA